MVLTRQTRSSTVTWCPCLLRLLDNIMMHRMCAQGSTAAEWKQCHAAAQLNKRGAEMAEQMQRGTCLLLMQYVPGAPLFNVDQPFWPENLEQTAADLGRWLLLYTA